MDLFYRKTTHSIVNRRTLIGSVSSLGVVLFAGCVETEENAESVELCWLGVSNRTDTSHNVSLRVTEDDKTLYEETISVEASDEGSAGEFSVPSSELPSGAGAYLVEARLDDDWTEVYLPDVVQDRVAVEALIDTVDNHPQLKLWHSTHPEACHSN